MTRLATVINKIIDIINTKQPTLVSGENIKKLNGTDIVGSGNIPVKTVGGESILGDGNVGVKTINGETMIGSGDAEIVGTGTLTTTSQNVIGAINEHESGKATKAELTTAQATLNGRIDNIIAGGTAPSEAEIVDARQGADGINYASLGGAIRGQVSDVKSELNEFETDTIETVVTSKNLYNPAVSETGAIQSNGTVATNGSWAGYKTSDFIPLDENTDYVLSSWIMSSGTETTTRKLLLLYDENKAVINDSYQNAEQYSLTFNSSSNAKYVRCATVGTLGMQLEKGTNYSAFVPYAERKDLLIFLGETPSNQVIDLINSSDIITYEVGKNLANPNTLVTGAIQSDGSVSTNGAWTGYSTTDFIKIESAENYVASQWSNQGLLATGRMLLLLFDENKAPISGTYQNTDAVENLTFSNASAKYVRVSARHYMILQVEKGTTPTIYEKFSGKNVIAYPLGNVPMAQTQASNPLYKKKWAVCGDSFTNGATENRLTDGKYTGQRIVYPYIIGNRNEMDIVKFFEGGRTLAYPSDGTFHNSLTDPNADCYYQNIPSDADYITIYLGINDEHHATGGGDGEDPTGVIPLGTITDNTTATYYGAWNVVLSWLIENRPFAHIGMIVTNGLSVADYRTAQIAIAEKYGIPYIDLNGDKQTHAMIRSVNPDISSTVKNIINQKQAVNYPSNTHPNDDAHIFESTFIEEFLRSI